MSRLLTLIAALILTSSCDTKKIIYVAGTLDSCKDNPSQKCLQVKENIEDEWTHLPNNIEGFEFKEGYMQKIEVAVNKVKNQPTNVSPLSYKFVRLIFEEAAILEVPISLILDKNHIGKWQVTSMMGMDSLVKQPTLIFKEGEISGNAGCNNYGATYALNGNEITFVLGMVTKMYCTNMPIEKAYFDCLTKAETYKLSRDEITFYDANNEELMHCTSIKE